MSKKILVLITATLLLSACGSSSSRIPSVPTVTYTPPTSETTTNSNVITGSVSVDKPALEDYTKLSLEEAKELSRNISNYQNSDSFKLPEEIDAKLVSSASSDTEFEGYTSMSGTQRCVFSKQNMYYRLEDSSNSYKRWQYIGERPLSQTSDDYVGVDATQNGTEGKYQILELETSEYGDYVDNLYVDYSTSYFDIITGNSVLAELDIDDSDESVDINCEFYTKGAGSLLVYGTITLNNYKFDLGNVSFTGSLKTALTYTWDNYIITSGETNSLFYATVLFREVSGSFSTKQTTSLSPKDFSKPNFANFIEITDTTVE